MKILVTGADGFIGSHLTETLVRAGYDVRAFCLYNSFGSWGWLDHCAPDVKGKFEVFMGDVRDPFGVREAMKDVEVVLHLAALIAIPYSYHSPQNYVETNISGTLNVLMAARDLGVRRVVHTSTSEVYGTALFVPITEDHPKQPQSPYSATKIGADAMAYSFYASFDQDVVIARPFNTYGPRQSARAVIPTIITQLLSGKDRIKLGALSPTRDFNYVEDTARAFMALISAGDQVKGQSINFGSNYEISIEDTAKTIAQACGVDLTIESDEQRFRPEKSEVNRLWAANAKAQELLGWAPEHGGLEGFRRGIEKTVAWFKDPANLAGYKADIYNL
ncbi:MAG: NAD-dependent 4,6-dehydratase LegB [Neomegalonema sp.]|nr:NAD-dependent 4,6-dehydratase LegB [Neomegalonema sp.]